MSAGIRVKFIRGPVIVLQSVPGVHALARIRAACRCSLRHRLQLDRVHLYRYRNRVDCKEAHRRCCCAVVSYQPWGFYTHPARTFVNQAWLDQSGNNRTAGMTSGTYDVCDA